MTLQAAPQRIPSVRGLVPLHNHRGQPYEVTDVHRWIRLNRTVFKCQKIDLLSHDPDPPHRGEIVAYARGLDLPVSLRTDCRALPPTVDRWKDLGYFDVLLAPGTDSMTNLAAWLARCTEAGVPVRIHLPIPLPADLDSDVLANQIASANVCAVHLSTLNPFSDDPSPARNSGEALDRVFALAQAIAAKGIEVNLVGLPLNRVPDTLQSNLIPGDGVPIDHQLYEAYSYRLAANLYRRSPYVASKIILAMISRYVSAPSPVDKTVLEWLFTKHRFAYFWVLFFRKFTRDWRRPLGPPRPLRDTTRATIAELDDHLAMDNTLEVIRAYSRLFPALASGEDDWTASPEWRKQLKYYGAIDKARIDPSAGQRALAEAARGITSNRPPDRVVEGSGYGAFETFHEPLSNAVRWMSISNREQVSSGIARLDAAFTASVTFGGGNAEYIGFAIGRHCRILCPIQESTHRLTLNVAADGAFVLLRDGEIMQPVEFHGQYYVPALLNFPLELQLCLWNIDDHITTQGVDLWFGEHHGVPNRDRVTFSVVIFSTRFSRRLQFVIQSILHQHGVSPGEIEIIVGYVPGIDTTDDVIDSIRVAHPDAPILRMPFPDQYRSSKGFVLNECMRAARGEWIMILDSDILLPPDMFERLKAESGGAVFLAPRGRHMLDRETTAKILLGEIVPWNSWGTLVACSQDIRQDEAEGIPIGYCQVFKTECLTKVQYAEYEHFEGADSDFGLDMRREFGPEKRLDTPVLHLDHGGSQWFGAYKHQ